MTDFEIRAAEGKGKGVFAVRGLPRGAPVHTLSGRRITIAQSFASVFRRKFRFDDPLQIGLNLVIALDEISISFNHSCDPNCILVREADLVAKRDIAVGEEITYDYSLTVVPSFYSWAWRMKCHCGSPNCRKIAGDLASVPAGNIEYLLSNKQLQDYIINYLHKKSGIESVSTDHLRG